MATSTIIWILVAVVALLLLAAFLWIAANKRKVHRHDEAVEIRQNAEEESHRVGAREARAAEIAARARGAQAEADAKAAEAAGLEHQAKLTRSDASTAREELNKKFARADELDPDRPSRRSDSTTRPDNPIRQDATGRNGTGRTDANGRTDADVRPDRTGRSDVTGRPERSDDATVRLDPKDRPDVRRDVPPRRT